MPKTKWRKISPGDREGGVTLSADGGFRWGTVVIELNSVILSNLEVGGLACTGGLLAVTFILPSGRSFKYNKLRKQWYQLESPGN